jgi:hypothetical protein
MALFTDKQLLAIGAVVAVGGYLVWKNGLPALGTAINPTNPDNVFYGGVNAVGQSVTGQADWSLGTSIYNWLHPNELAELGLTPRAAKTTDTITGN